MSIDTVPHATLLNKLQDYEITGGVFNFYQAYLSNHLQCANVNGIFTRFIWCSTRKSTGATSLCCVCQRLTQCFSAHHTFYVC